jgi:hypothetical protein
MKIKTIEILENKGHEQFQIKKAICGSPRSPLIIGDIRIPCYVLEDGTRVLSGRGMQTALNLGQSHGMILRQFLARVSWLF